jgi:hypothetical protein
MNNNEPTFRWDSHGITAYDFNNDVSDSRLSGINKSKGVRFDRFGLYGYSGIDGETWKPKSVSRKNDSVPNIDSMSTFALTWEGLKVVSTTEKNGTKQSAVLRIGDGAKSTIKDDTILRVARLDEDGNETPTFYINSNGDMSWGGEEGIYSSNGELTINASTLKTGSLQVYDESENLIFYAGLEPPAATFNMRRSAPAP